MNLINNTRGKGAPDFLVTIDSLVLGYVENEKINVNLMKLLKVIR